MGLLLGGPATAISAEANAAPGKGMVIKMEKNEMPSSWTDYIKLMNQEIIPALGCTEPVAVALAAAKAAEALGCAREEIAEMEILVSRNILKNAMSVIIPGTTLYGLEYAAALGFAAGDPGKDLEVLTGLCDKDIALAQRWVNGHKVKVSLAENDETIYIDALAKKDGACGRAVIQGKHNHFLLVERDGETLLQNRKLDEEKGEEIDFSAMSLRDIFDFASGADIKTLEFIEKTNLLNYAISQEGLKNDYGLMIGKGMQARQKKGLVGKDLQNLAIMQTTAAIDARMAGCSMPVMSNSGSGNQGITATVPVCVVAAETGASEEQKIRALTLSHMTAIYIKHHLDRLSALCGAMVAASGVSCAVVYLLGGGYGAVEKAITNMIANITGIICDGAKADCALKVYASLQAAFEAAYLALDGVCAAGIEGIVTGDVEQTIDNLGTLTMEGMKITDKVILDIMLSKTSGDGVGDGR